MRLNGDIILTLLKNLHAEVLVRHYFEPNSEVRMTEKLLNF